MVPDSLSADEILRCAKPEHLFPVGNIEEIRKVYKRLARKWHPDVNLALGPAVFAHITKLHTEALQKLGANRWEGPGTVSLRTPTKEVVLLVRTTAPFELGQTLISDNAATFVVDKDFGPLYMEGVHAQEKFRYSSDRMKTEAIRYLPKRHWAAQLADGRYALQVEKTPDLLRLADVITHLKGLDPKHTAWVVSSLLNLTCYLSYAGLVHHDISPDTYYVSPRFHSGALLGGWWYHAREGHPITVVPKRTYHLMPFKARMQKLAMEGTDLELVRATGRECLAGKKAPAPMQHWLTSVGSGTAVEQYRQWLAVLKESFGERRFVEMKVDADAVYGPLEVVHG